MDYTACGEVLQGKESSMRSVGRRGMRISNRGSDTEIFHRLQDVSITAESKD